MSSARSSGQPRQLDDDLWLLDTLYQGEPGVIASYMLTGNDGVSLIDVGSAATTDQLVHSIRQTQHEPGDIVRIIVTHVHLDHAGASGTLNLLAPNARVYVHPLGAPHLADPTKLVGSAARIYGDRMEALWGKTEPVPLANIISIEDGQTLQIGNRRLLALHTPGHAVHHIAYFDADRHELFAGDVTGVVLEGCSYVRPPTPPPDLDIEAWKTSIVRLRTLSLDRLYLPHFGRVNDVARHLDELETRLDAWGAFVLAGMREGKSTEVMAQELAQMSDTEVRRVLGGPSDDILRRYELATNYRMTVQGYERYWRKRHPNRLGT